MSLKHSEYGRLVDLVARSDKSVSASFLKNVIKPTSFEKATKSKESELSAAFHVPNVPPDSAPADDPLYLFKDPSESVHDLSCMSPKSSRDGKRSKSNHPPPAPKFSANRQKGVLQMSVASTTAVNFPLHRLVIPRIGENIDPTDSFKKAFLLQVKKKVLAVQTSPKATISDCRNVMAIVCQANPSLWTTDQRADPTGSVSTRSVWSSKSFRQKSKFNFKIIITFFSFFLGINGQAASKTHQQSDWY